MKCVSNYVCKYMNESTKKRIHFTHTEKLNGITLEFEHNYLWVVGFLLWFLYFCFF